jgi:hypothetical protein
MPIFRYSMTGRWLKGNTHIHSTASDGGKNYQELANLYHTAGYNFLFRTDHWVASDASTDQEDYPLLWLDGIEMDGTDSTGAGYDVVAIGTFNEIHPGMSLQQGMDTARAQGGMLILAHPHWSGNSFEDALRWKFDGVEVYNHVCRWLNGKSEGGPYWNIMLSRFPNTLAFAVDDAHLTSQHPGWNGGGVGGKARENFPPANLTSLQKRKFYSSSGPLLDFIQ